MLKQPTLGDKFFAFGFIIMALVYTIGGISGSQINPASSIALL